jgi:hypothetical protein
MHDLPSLFDLAINEGISGLTIERCVPCGNENWEAYCK